MTLFRYLLADVLKLAGLTTVALVTLIAFAATVKPLADGRVDLGGALRFMALAIVPMLQFALPFAAGFSATLVYHRFASDRESSAAMAGGIGHRALLAPALVSGALLGGGLLLLAEQAIPHFLRSMERLITRNVATLIVSAIERGESVDLGDVIIHAREVVRVGPDAELGATDRLSLRGVLAARAGTDGRIGAHVSAERVHVWLFDEAGPGGPSTAVQMRFMGAAGRGPDDSLVQQEFTTRRILLPGAFTDDPKFLTWGKLRDVRHRPEKHINKVEGLRRDLEQRLAERRVILGAAEALRLDGALTLRRGDERLIISGGSAAMDGAGLAISPTDSEGSITLDWRLLDGQRRRQSASSLTLLADDDGGAPASSLANGGAPAATALLRLEVERLVTLDQPGRETGGERARAAFSGLRFDRADGSGASSGPAPTASVYDLLREADDLERRNPGLVGDRARAAAEALRRMNDDLQREVTSKQQERLAFALSCPLMVLLGATIAMILRDSMPLPVYLWSFFPALGSVITISSGQRLTHKEGSAGLFLLWGGVGVLAVILAVSYSRLRRH